MTVKEYRAITKADNPIEDIEQIDFVDFLEKNNIKHTSIPNSTYTTSIRQKKKNKRMGLCGGFPDMVCIVGDVLVIIEMKRRKGGVVSDTQKDWIAALGQCKRIVVGVAKGSDEAIEMINKARL